MNLEDEWKDVCKVGGCEVLKEMNEWRNVHREVNECWREAKKIWMEPKDKGNDWTKKEREFGVMNV